MTSAELKFEIDHLSSEERCQLTAYLAIRDRMLEPDFGHELTHKIDDISAERWIPLEEVEKRLLF